MDPTVKLTQLLQLVILDKSCFGLNIPQVQHLTLKLMGILLSILQTFVAHISSRNIHRLEIQSFTLRLNKGAHQILKQMSTYMITQTIRLDW